MSRDTVTVEWMNVPDEVRRTMRALIHARLWRLPAWCTRLCVNWDDATDDPKGDGRPSIARMRVDTEYRTAALIVGPQWLSESSETRAATIDHEFAHVPLQAMTDLFIRVVGYFETRNRALHDEYVEAWRLAWEGAVCDTTEIVTAALNRRRP